MKPADVATVLGALVLGATAMYYLDPEQGRRRRALVTDRVNSASRDTRDYLDSRRKRTADRMRGVVARVRGRLTAKPPSDQQLAGHVRARLGRAVSYPHAIETQVQQGRVALRGDILAREFNTLMVEMWSIPGVAAIDNQLSMHDEPGNVPRLQGKPHRPGRLRVLHLAHNTLSTLALAGGIGLGVTALRSESRNHTGLLSLAIALLAYGTGDGAWRLARQRRIRLMGWQEVGEHEQQHGKPEQAGEHAPAPAAAPAIWH